MSQACLVIGCSRDTSYRQKVSSNSGLLNLPGDNRLFRNAVFWILRTEDPWWDLPPDQEDWKNTNSRFCRWRGRRVWERLLEPLIDEPDFEWLMKDASYIKDQLHGNRAQGGNRAKGLTKVR